MSSQLNANRPIQPENIHICGEGKLVTRACRTQQPTDIVLAPEQFHRRNLKRAIADANRPRSSLALLTPATLASEIIATHNETAPTVLDRTDRLRLVEEIVSSQPGDVARLTQVFGASLTTHLEKIEAARKELSLLTGHQPARLSAFESVCRGLEGVASLDACDLLAGVSGLEDHLRNRVETYVSPGVALESGQKILRDSGGDAWRERYPTIERVNVVGISTLGTPLLEFLAAVGRETTATVKLYLRAYTGPRIASRLQSRLARHTSSDPSASAPATRPELAEFMSTPVTEIVTETRADEARAALAVCDGLRKAGVSVSDIALVARDIDRYERALTHAASAYGRQLSFWTQLELKRTLPYRLVAATCSLLAARSDDDVDCETLFRPLEYYWLPPGAEDGIGQPSALFTPAELSELRRTLSSDQSGTLRGWYDALAMTAELDPGVQMRFESYLNWCESHPREPEPDDMLSALCPLVETFENVVLPGIEQRDTAAYTETSRVARAIQRVAGDDESEHLLRETHKKYSKWLARHHVDPSWATILEVLEAIATARPGRREHDNAERIDVLDATDTWLRSYPFVIALGFVDGEWPKQPHGAFPVEARTAVANGAPVEARRLAVRGAWTEEREYDHAADAIQTATNHLIVTRYTKDFEGVSYQRSPLLAEISPVELSNDAYHRLIGPDTILPDRIRRSVPMANTDSRKRYDE